MIRFGMKSFRISLLALVALATVLQSCKKDSEEDSRSYLSGSLSFSLPTYVEPGYTKTFMIDTLMTLSREDGGGIGYYIGNAYTDVADTLVLGDGTILEHYYTFTAPDEMLTSTIRLAAFTEDKLYYGSTQTATYTVVKSGLDGKGSITGFVYEDPQPSFTDARDGKTYLYTTIGGTDWMRQNLAWEGSGAPYMDCGAMSDIFGRYYTWEEASTACPEGWRLPSDEDWTALGRALGSETSPRSDINGLAGALMQNLYFNETRMWEFWPEVKITDKSGLSIMPAGYATLSEGRYAFDQLYSYATIWSSDSDDDSAYLRYIYQDKNILYCAPFSKTDFAASVRCVR